MASTGRSSQGGGAGSRGGSGGQRGGRGAQSGGRGASAGEASLNASASASSGPGGGAGGGGINIGGSAGVSGATGAGGTAGSSGRSGASGTTGTRGNAELSGSATLGGQSPAPGARSQSGTSRSDAERQVPIGREAQQQGRATARVQGSAQGSGTPFGFMRRFGEEMDRLFSDFGFAPPGIESQLSLLGWPGSGGRSSASLNANLPRASANEGRTGSSDAGGTAMGRPMSSGAFASRGGWMPQVEVLQRGNDLVVRADLPGLRREDVHVEIDDGMLTVSGERRYQSESDEEGVYHSERSYGRFSRAIPLPPGTDEDAVQARFTDGVLEVTLPLPQEQSRARRIEIR